MAESKPGLAPGIIGKKEIVVTEELTAAALGSGLLPVFGTPALVALMEETCHTSVGEFLDEGQGTVGIGISVRHLAASPVGMKITCTTKLISVEGRALTFSVEAFDEVEKIGTALHERFIIDNERFMNKAMNKGAL